MVCFCEDASETLCSIKCVGLLAKLRKYQLLQLVGLLFSNHDIRFIQCGYRTGLVLYKQLAPSFPLPLNSNLDKISHINPFLVRRFKHKIYFSNVHWSIITKHMTKCLTFHPKCNVRN